MSMKPTDGFDNTAVQVGDDNDNMSNITDEDSGEPVTKNNRIALIIKWIFVLMYNVYLSYAIYYHYTFKNKCNWQWCNGIGILLVITVLVYAGLVSKYVIRRLIVHSKAFTIHVQKPLERCASSLLSQTKIRIGLHCLAVTSITIFLVIDTSDDRRRLISASGVVVFVIFSALCSKHPKEIRWRQVTWGLSLQFVFALMILRWPLGKAIVECLGQKVDRFLSFTNEGSGFVFGYLVNRQIFNVDVFPNNQSLAYNVTSEVNDYKAVPSVVVFSALSVIYFFSFIVNILFYYGIIQWATARIGWMLRITIGTTAVESISAASNIFLGQAMAPLLIKPYLADLTMSEINAVMTSGFATIAGTVMAAYISFGVSPAHLLSASVMSAPAALASAKLLLPETQASKVRKATDIELSNVTTTTNLLDAATEGASTAAFLVLNITAIVVAFIAFVAFLNSLVAFFAGLVGFPDLTFEVLLGYVFVPVAFVMGVDWSECQTVGTLIGIKTVANEFIAYRRLGLLIAEGQLSPRAAIIATYALCGYANPGSIGVQIATLSALCPERKADFTATVGRAFLAGTIACFLTACIAGALLAPE